MMLKRGSEMTTIQSILKRRYQAILVENTRYLNNPYDPERAHDLRVMIRTLRGLIKFLKRRIDPAVYTDIDTNLSQAAILFGDLRELDVLIEQAGLYTYDHPDKDADYLHLFSVLRQNRQDEMRQTLNDQAQEKFQNELKQVDKQLTKLKFTQSTGWHQYIVKELNRRNHKLVKIYEELNFKDYPEVHHVRKRSKTLRYASTYFGDFAPNKANKSAKLAKDIQDDTGTITDAHVNYMRLRQLADKMTKDADKQLLLKIADEQLKKFE